MIKDFAALQRYRTFKMVPKILKIAHNKWQHSELFLNAVAIGSKYLKMAPNQKLFLVINFQSDISTNASTKRLYCSIEEPGNSSNTHKWTRNVSQQTATHLLMRNVVLIFFLCAYMSTRKTTKKNMQTDAEKI